MKTFFFMGRNPENKSGVSWKMWKIERAGRTVTVFWGPVVLRKRRVVPSAKLQTKVFRLSSEATAKAFELARIESKLRSGYQRRPRRKVTRS